LTLGCELKLSIETPPPFSRNLRVVFVQTDTAIFLPIKHCASADLQTKFKNEAWHFSETRVIPCPAVVWAFKQQETTWPWAVCSWGINKSEGMGGPIHATNPAKPI